MRRTSFADMNCSVARSLEIVGEWWTLLILRDAFLGVTRFDDLQRRLGIARNVLTARLDRLVAHDILERRVYDEARDRADYRLTAKGRALWPVLTALRQWGDEWLYDDQPPLLLEHRSCGNHTHATMACDSCGEPLSLTDLRLVPGPAATGDELPG